MKHLYILSMAAALIALSCENETASPVAVDDPLLSVTAEDGQTTTVAERLGNGLRLPFNNMTDLSSVYVTFKIARGASLVYPSNTLCILNFEENNPLEVIVNNGVADIRYMLTAVTPARPVFKSVVAMDGDRPAEVEVDDVNRTITFQFLNRVDINDVEVALETGDGAFILGIIPKSFDLSKPNLISVYNGLSEVQYKMTGFSTDSFAKDGKWTDVSDQYATEAEGTPFFKLYKTEVAGDSRTCVAAVQTFVGGSFDMTVLGNGGIGSNIPSSQRLTTVANSNKAKWPLIINGMSGWESPALQALIYRDGTIVQAPGSNYPCPPAIGMTADGKMEIKYVKVEDGILKASDQDGTEPDRQFTPWNPVFAASGYSLLVRDGEIYPSASDSDYSTLCAMDGRPVTTEDAKSCSRIALCLNERGKMFIVSVEGDTRFSQPGMTLDEFARFLLALDVRDALQLTYGNACDAYYNVSLPEEQKHTIRTQPFYNTSGVFTSSATGQRASYFFGVCQKQ
ncbi:MAG: phosphodiester glycosidase family protein [Candidatus Cryptobacteroides sp.]